MSANYHKSFATTYDTAKRIAQESIVYLSLWKMKEILIRKVSLLAWTLFWKCALKLC